MAPWVMKAVLQNCIAANNLFIMLVLIRGMRRYPETIGALHYLSLGCFFISTVVSFFIRAAVTTATRRAAVLFVSDFTAFIVGWGFLCFIDLPDDMDILLQSAILAILNCIFWVFV